MNTDKTEIMAVGTSSRLSQVDCNLANIGGSSIPFKTSVKYLGVKTDQTLSVPDQISSVCHASFLKLRCLASIRPYLSERTSARLVAALITSRLDYCNSVLAGLPAEQIGRLQRIQNSAARLVLKKNKNKKNKKPKTRPYNAQWTPLATREIPLRIQDRNSCLPSLRRYTSLLPFSFSLHVSDFTHPPIIERKTLENP